LETILCNTSLFKAPPPPGKVTFVVSIVVKSLAGTLDKIPPPTKYFTNKLPLGTKPYS
jgi:hypothetical protein